MPFAGFVNFDDCVKKTMEKQGYDEETARKVCGKLQTEQERQSESSNPLHKVRTAEFDINTANFEDIEGGLLIRNVKLMAAGTWRDSNVGTPLHYSPHVLSNYAENWSNSSLWSRHAGGSPRSITDKIGKITNQRFEDNAVMGSVWLHGKTAASKDTINLIKSDNAQYISVEHTGKEQWDGPNRRYESIDINFIGAAVVDKGACAVCRLSEDGTPISQLLAEEADIMSQDNKDKDTSGVEEKFKEFSEASEAKIRELESKIVQLEDSIPKTVEEMTVGIKELSEKIESLESLRELSGKYDELTKDKKEISTRIKELEAQPAPKTTNAGLDLGEQINVSPIRVNKGEISMEEW